MIDVFGLLAQYAVHFIVMGWVVWFAVGYVVGRAGRYDR